MVSATAGMRLCTMLAAHQCNVRPGCPPVAEMRVLVHHASAPQDPAQVQVGKPDTFRPSRAPVHAETCGSVWAPPLQVLDWRNGQAPEVLATARRIGFEALASWNAANSAADGLHLDATDVAFVISACDRDFGVLVASKAGTGRHAKCGLYYAVKLLVLHDFESCPRGSVRRRRLRCEEASQPCLASVSGSDGARHAFMTSDRDRSPTSHTKLNLHQPLVPCIGRFVLHDAPGIAAAGRARARRMPLRASAPWNWPCTCPRPMAMCEPARSGPASLSASSLA